MSPLARREDRAPHRGLVAVVVAFCAFMPWGVATCLLVGAGLEARAPFALAVSTAFALTLLPIAGLASLLERIGRIGRIGPIEGGAATRRATWLLSTWIWTLGVLAAFPAFAPGLRSDAARRGAEACLASLPAPLRSPLAGAIATLAALPGADGERPAGSASAQPGEGSDTTTSDPPEAVVSKGETARPATRREPPHGAGNAAAVELAYRGDGRELDVEVGLDGPHFGERFRMIFDTGASFTTVTPDALARIDVAVPGDAPRVRLNTAGGEIEAPLVLLDAVWMGDQPIEWVTVAACPSCTAPGRAGLLGLNVSSQFRVEIDASRKRIHLDPTPGDRLRDIRPWVELRAKGVQHGDERIDFEITLLNRAPRAIAKATVEIDCGASGFAVEVAEVAARGETSSALSVPATSPCEGFRLDLLSARWVLDRF